MCPQNPKFLRFRLNPHYLMLLKNPKNLMFPCFRLNHLFP
jgi:hypothetical protein